MNFGQKDISIEYILDGKTVTIHGKGIDEKDFASRNNIVLEEPEEEKPKKKSGRKSKNV